MKKSFFLIMGAVFLTALLLIKIHKTADILHSHSFSEQNVSHQVKHNRKIIVLTPTVVRSEAEFATDRRHMEQAIRKRLDQDAAEIKSSEILEKPSDHLVEIFKQMTPTNAAEIIENLNDEQIIELLSMMDVQSAAAILSQIDADKAARLTQKLLTTSRQEY